MAFVGFQYEPVSLDVSKVPNTHEKSRKSQSVTECLGCGKCGAVDTNVECLSSGKVESLGYFQLSDMRCDDRNWSPKELV